VTTAWLVSIEDDPASSGRRYPLDAPCLVGRGPYNHVVLDDTRISRQHAKISPESGGHVVYDLNSANGTFVNDLPVKRQKLGPNDTVKFGPFKFRFVVDQLVDEKSTLAAKKFVEVQTSVGFEAPSKIVDTLDAAHATNPGLPPSGLSELEDADRKLRTLYSFMQAVSTTLDTNELLDRILTHLLDVFPQCDVATIYLRAAGSDAMEPRRSLRRQESQSQSTTLPPQFYEEVVEKGRAVLSAPAGGRRAKPSGGSTMHAPVMYDGATEGVLMVRVSDGGGTPFQQDDLDLLTGLASQAALALANARMHAGQLKQQRLQQDLLLAEQIQKSFLPRALPEVEGLEFATEYRPAFSVGGDFYDVFWLNYDRIGMFIGDVSGKGVSAALLMARISSDLRLAAAGETEPAKALGHVNRIVLERRQPDIFVTGIYLTLNVKTHQIMVANAGHLPLLVRRRSEGVLQRVDGGTGTAIGIFDDAEYDQVELALEPGDSLVMCTDGVLEATNIDGVQFGFDRLEASLRAGTSRTAELAARLQADLRAHVGTAPQSDDLTLIVCGVAERAVTRKRRREDEPTDLVKLPRD
jgi:serine phosphatase RsbU (regulator of sigma subunit)/pSer/pThr/pTyr-binding forkhead associated (FHA) protein